MFQNIGTLEIIIIGILIIVLFGSKRLADFIRGMGKGIEEYKNSKKEE